MKPYGEYYEKPVQRAMVPFSSDTVKAACVRISGLGCNNCVTHVKNSLGRLDGVLLVEIALEDGLATMVYDPLITSPVDIIRAVESAAHDGKHRYWADVIAVTDVSDVLPSSSFGEDKAVLYAGRRKTLESMTPELVTGRARWPRP